MNSNSSPKQDATCTPWPVGRKQHRPLYSTEQDDFIRFVREDLSHSWDICTQLYNQFWHPSGEGERSPTGLGKRYRLLTLNMVRVRGQRTNSKLGVSANTKKRYPWMMGYDPKKQEMTFTKEIQEKGGKFFVAMEQEEEDKGDEAEGEGKSKE